MNKNIFEYHLDSWDTLINSEDAKPMMQALESGKVIYFPQLNFSFNDQEKEFLLNRNLIPKGAKNISYNPSNQQVSGFKSENAAADLMKYMMQRYHYFASKLLTQCCPNYQIPSCNGRTSFRPVEIKGRQAVSYRKDDTRLHVDAFPSTPVGNLRILRIFSNVNPFGQTRSWRLGEPFGEVVEKFLPKIRAMLPFEAEILYRLRATRRRRTIYDHYMLQMHNMMKKDLDYQSTVDYTAMEFPSGSTWVVFTDVVSHAALSGRYLLEQTFYPAVENMLQPSLSPQHQLLEELV